MAQRSIVMCLPHVDCFGLSLLFASVITSITSLQHKNICHLTSCGPLCKFGLHAGPQWGNSDCSVATIMFQQFVKNFFEMYRTKKRQLGCRAK